MSDHLSRRGLIGGSVAFAGLAAAACGKPAPSAARPLDLLNVSYDPTRELYKAYNAWFAPRWAEDHGGQALEVKQSHGGSGSQAQAVIGGLQADVVTLALGYDIDTIARKSGRVATNWQTRLPDNSSPYTSTIVFLVRGGNPKKIRDWGDLVGPGVEIVTPNPKTGGGARWNYLAAYAYALRQPGGTEARAQDFVRAVYARVPVLDSGARGSTTTFAQRGIGDVLLTWENEAYLAQAQLGADKVELVIPPTSILTEPAVAMVDAVVQAKGTAALAEAYLKGLYDAPGQEIIARNHYRPRSAAALAASGVTFQALELATIDDLGGWARVQAAHFDDGGVFDRIYRPKAG